MLSDGPAVVAFEPRRSLLPVPVHERRERRHRSGDGTHVPALQILRHHPERRVALHVHALHAAAIDEVVDVRTAPRGRQRRVDVGYRNAERVRFRLIDVEVQLRRVVEAVLAHLREQRILARRGEQLVARRHQRLVAEIAAIFELHFEAGGVAEFAHRRRQQREDLRVANLRKRLDRAPDDRLRAVDLAGSLVPVGEVDERLAGVLTLTGKAEAGDDEYRVHVRPSRRPGRNARPASRLRACAIASRRPAA